MEQVVPLKEGEYDISDLVFTPESMREDMDTIRAVLDTVQDPWIRRLVDAFWNDAAFNVAFSSAAAAKKWHHEYRGGLARHTCEMFRLGDTMCELFSDINRDVLVAGIFLHDIGKLEEMTHDLVVEYTTPGRLLGHVQIGAAQVSEKIGAIDGFPETLRLQVLHCILAHHRVQYGSRLCRRRWRRWCCTISTTDAQARPTAGLPAKRDRPGVVGIYAADRPNDLDHGRRLNRLPSRQAAMPRAYASSPENRCCTGQRSM